MKITRSKAWWMRKAKLEDGITSIAAGRLARRRKRWQRWWNENMTAVLLIGVAAVWFALLLLGAFLQYPRCDLAHDGAFFGTARGTALQCRCTRAGASARGAFWICDMVERN